MRGWTDRHSKLMGSALQNIRKSRFIFITSVTVIINMATVNPTNALRLRNCMVQTSEARWCSGCSVCVTAGLQSAGWNCRQISVHGGGGGIISATPVPWCFDTPCTSGIIEKGMNLKGWGRREGCERGLLVSVFIYIMEEQQCILY